MTHLRHIIVLVLLLLTLGFAAKAQSTPFYPYEGSTHTYTVNGLDEGVDYAYYITANADGSGLYDDGATGEFDFETIPTGTIGAGESAASVDIGWNNGASLHIYQLWLEVTIPGGCSNKIRAQVTPQAVDFDLLSENIPDTNTHSCPVTSESDGYNPLASAYTAGFSTLHFLVKRENGTENAGTPTPGDTYDWSFIPELEVDPAILGLSNVIISIEGATSGVITPVANRYTVSGFDDDVTVTVTIDNAPGTIRDVTLKVTFGVEDTTNLSDNNPGNDNVTHTIEIMPLIDGMGGV